MKSFDYLSIKIIPYNLFASKSGSITRQIRIELKKNDQILTLNEILEEDYFKSYFDQLFDIMKDKLKEVIFDKV